MKILSRLRYYVSSLPTLWSGVTNWPQVLPALVRRQPFIVRLKTGLQFKARSLMDIWIIKETCLDRDYETYGTPLQTGWRVIDIGAALGDFTVYAAKKVGSKGMVYAYEPFPQSFAILMDNLQLNHVSNVQAESVAIGQANTEAQISLATGVPVRFSTVTSSTHTVPVPVITFEQVLQTMGSCDFLKMDCEGAEYSILLGTSAESLRRIRHVSMEFHDGVTPHTHHELVHLFESAGFIVKTYPNPVHHETGFLYAYQPSARTPQ